MFPWTFYIIVGIVLLFVSYLIAKAIWTPIKLKRETKRYNEWRKGTQSKPFVFK